MKNTHSAILIVVLGILFGLSQSVFVLPETHQAMVIQFGKPVALHTTPGLKFKFPLIDQVTLFDKRVLDIDAIPEEVLLADRKRIVVDTFARYRIIDMLAFRNALTNEQLANTRLNNNLNSTMRAVLGNATLVDLLSEKRSALMTTIRNQVNASVKPAGIEIVDVRIGKADLPEQTSQSIYARMRTEREREAAEFRAQGQEQAQEIRSKADKERTILLAEAEKQAEILRGQGDETAIKTYAQAFSRDAEFYSFYRTMQAYKESLPGENTTLILSPDGEFFKFFENSKNGR
jgi:membrane protease subunit HflC